MNALLSMLIGLAVLAVQALLVLLAAPMIRALADKLAALLSGATAFPLMARWRQIRRLWKTAPTRPAALMAVSFAPVLALSLALLAALLVPMFTLGLPHVLSFAPGADLLMVCALLGLARLVLLLPALSGRVRTAQVGFGNAVVAAIAAPALLFAIGVFFTVSATTALEPMLLALAAMPPLTIGAPFALAACALLLAGWDGGWRSTAQEEPLLLREASGSDRAMMMLASDVISLSWMNLAGDLAWPQSLARSLTELGGGLALWVVRCLIACFLMTAMRLFAPGSIATMRLRAGLALLLAVLAIQFLTTS